MAAEYHSLTALAPRGMPSLRMAVVPMAVAAALNELERWVNWGLPLALAMPMAKLGTRTTAVAEHSVLIALAPRGMSSSRLAAVLMGAVVGLSWLEFAVNWVSSLVLKGQTAAL